MRPTCFMAVFCLLSDIVTLENTCGLWMSSKVGPFEAVRLISAFIFDYDEKMDDPHQRNWNKRG